MKRILATVLALALVFGGILTPTLAAPVAGEHISPVSAFWDITYEPGYYDGYYEAYDIGWEEGNAQAIIDKANGVYAPKYDYDVFTQEETSWETYEDGYDHGLKYGYWRGYTDYYFAEYYDAGYADGTARAEADFASGSQGYWGASFPDWTMYATDEEYRYAKGYYTGWTDATYDLAYAYAYPIGYADGQNDTWENEPQDLYEMTYEEWDMARYYYADGLDSGYWAGHNDVWYAAYLADLEASQQRQITALGGTVGQINVRLNEKMIPFGDAFPESQNDRTMIPVRALMEFINAEVSWDNESKVVTVQTDALLLEITVGADTATVTENEETRELALDAPAYLKDGRCYVPLRFITELLGYDVHWDAQYQSVILLDKTAIIAQIDEGFSVYNAYAKSNAFDMQARRLITSNLELKLELLDSINGNKTFAFPLKVDMHLGDGGIAIDGYVDLTQLKDAMILSMQSYSDYFTWPEELDFVSAKHEFSAKLSPDGDLYLHCPIVDTLLASFLGAASKDETETWYYIDLNALAPDWKSMLSKISVGEIIYQATDLNDIYGYNTMNRYEDIQTMADLYGSMFGDKNFTRVGSDHRMSMDLDDLITLTLPQVVYDDSYTEYMEAELRAMYDVFKLDLTIKQNGGYTLSAQVKTNPSYYRPATNLEMNGSGDKNGDKADGLYQIKNLLNASFKQTTTVQSSRNAPNWEIPKDANVVDLFGNTTPEKVGEVIATQVDNFVAKLS